MDDWNDTTIAGDGWVTGEHDRATRAYSPPSDPYGGELYETQPHELVYQEEEDRRVWSVIGPGALALGLLILSVAIGTYLGMRSADDGATEDARWPGEGPDTATSPDDEDSESAALEDDGDAATSSEVAEGEESAEEDEGTDDGTGDDSAGDNGGSPQVDVSQAEAASAASDRPGSPAEDSEGNSTTSTTVPDDGGDPPTTEPEECTWAPPGRPDHPNATDRPRECEG